MKNLDEKLVAAWSCCDFAGSLSRANAGAACSEFRPPQVRRLQRVRKLLGCEVEFNAHADGLSFDAALMDLPLVGADPFLHELMLKSCEEAIALGCSTSAPA